jgi:hypothetical protein
MGIRPSELYGIRDEWMAFCFDRAVITFGNSLKHELENAGDKPDKKSREIQRKREAILSKWLRLPRKFADPAKMMRG